MSKHHGDFYCLSCLHYSHQKNMILIEEYVKKIKIFVIL